MPTEPSTRQRPGFWSRLADPFREFGALAGALYIADRALRTVSPRLNLQVYEFMVQPVGELVDKPLLPPNLAKNIRLEELGSSHPDIANMEAREDIKRQRFAQGARCLAAYRRDELMSYLWFCQHQYEEDLVRCTYELADAQRSIFDFDLFVMPKHRLGLGFLGIWHGANEFLGAQGVRYTFSRLTRFNTASRKAHAHLGWKRVGHATFFCAWGLELMVSSLAPYVALTTGTGRVRLRLEPGKLLDARAQQDRARVSRHQE